MITGQPSGDVKELTVLDGVSGILKPGKFACLLGPPGSGKSVLMRALSGVVRADKTLKVGWWVVFGVW